MGLKTPAEYEAMAVEADALKAATLAAIADLEAGSDPTKESRIAKLRTEAESYDRTAETVRNLAIMVELTS